MDSTFLAGNEDRVNKLLLVSADYHRRNVLYNTERKVPMYCLVIKNLQATRWPLPSPPAPSHFHVYLMLDARLATYALQNGRSRYLGKYGVPRAVDPVSSRHRTVPCSKRSADGSKWLSRGLCWLVGVRLLCKATLPQGITPKPHLQPYRSLSITISRRLLVEQCDEYA